MDFKSLECFVTLYKEKNMHKAAEELFISQQGLSRAIINLESEMQCSLFHRERSGMIPTPEGERFYETAIRIRSEMAVLQRDLSMMQRKRPLLRIAFSFGVLHLLYPALREFERKHDDIDVVWEECIDIDCEQIIKNHEADIALIPKNFTNNNYITEKIFQSKVVLLVHKSHPLYERAQVSVADLKGAYLITNGGGFEIYNILKQSCLEHGFYPYIERGLRENNLIIRLVSQGEGLGVIVKYIADMMELPGIKAIPLPEDEISWDVSIVRARDHALTPEMELFWQFISDAARKVDEDHL